MRRRRVANSFPIGVPTTGLVLYLPLWRYKDPISQVKDWSGAGNNGTVSGPTPTSLGWYFDGVNDSISVPDATTLRFGTNPFSILLWTRPLAQGSNFPSWLSKVTTHIFNFYSYSWATSPKICLKLNDGTNTFDTAVGNTTIRTYSGWSMVGVLVSRSLGRAWGLYNGKLDISSAGANISGVTGAVNPTGALKIGVDPSAVVFFKGFIGEVLVFNNRILSAGEVDNYYQSTRARYGV